MLNRVYETDQVWPAYVCLIYSCRSIGSFICLNVSLSVLFCFFPSAGFSDLRLYCSTYMLYWYDRSYCLCMTLRSPFKSGPALASRLCKAAMLSRFHMVAKEAQREDLLASVSYREAKVLNVMDFFFHKYILDILDNSIKLYKLLQLTV